MRWSGPGEVRFVCTDRQTHASREIGIVTRFSDEDEMVILPTDRAALMSSRQGAGGTVVTRHARTTEGRGEELSDVMWDMRCPTCRRHVQWKDDRMVAVVDALLQASDSPRVVVDLSALPANLV